MKKPLSLRALEKLPQVREVQTVALLRPVLAVRRWPLPVERMVAPHKQAQHLLDPLPYQPRPIKEKVVPPLQQRGHKRSPPPHTALPLAVHQKAQPS